ncbi:MAG: ribonuclease III [Lachnospiraceae bacterium]|nr:ribonuclease III [Lachnospiraceae bacterium]
MNGVIETEELEKSIGYEFSDKDLLLQALTHSSFRNEAGQGRDYERLEFLGDAVLELVSSDFIYHENPGMREGDMTKLRASVVCEMSLANCAKEIGLSDHIRLGRGEDQQDSRHKPSIVSDVFEALIGAIYLEAGIEEAGKFIRNFVLNDIEHKALFHDSKTQLQNIAQARNWKLEYVLAEESGPQHDRRFVMACVINGKEVSRAQASSKKSAAQLAAYDALQKLETKDVS